MFRFTPHLHQNPQRPEIAAKHRMLTIQLRAQATGYKQVAAVQDSPARFTVCDSYNRSIAFIENPGLRLIMRLEVSKRVVLEKFV
jgi:hypothetical protein